MLGVLLLRPKQNDASGRLAQSFTAFFFSFVNLSLCSWHMTTFSFMGNISSLKSLLTSHILCEMDD